MPLLVEAGRDVAGNEISKPVIAANRVTNPQTVEVDESMARYDHTCDSWTGLLVVFVNRADGTANNYALTHTGNPNPTTITIGALKIEGNFTITQSDSGTPAQIRDSRNSLRATHGPAPQALAQGQRLSPQR